MQGSDGPLGVIQCFTLGYPRLFLRKVDRVRRSSWFPPLLRKDGAPGNPIQV